MGKWLGLFLYSMSVNLDAVDTSNSLFRGLHKLKHSWKFSMSKKYWRDMEQSYLRGKNYYYAMISLIRL